jgi:hypothetical protein
VRDLRLLGEPEGEAGARGARRGAAKHSGVADPPGRRCASARRGGRTPAVLCWLAVRGLEINASLGSAVAATSSRAAPDGPGIAAPLTGVASASSKRRRLTAFSHSASLRRRSGSRGARFAACGPGRGGGARRRGGSKGAWLQTAGGAPPWRSPCVRAAPGHLLRLGVCRRRPP